MNTLFAPIQKHLPVILLIGLFLPVVGFAQTEDPMLDRFEKLMKQMEEQMRMGMSFDSTFDGGRMQFSPDSNSYFYFRMDTSFNGTGSEFFDFSPFGSDSPNQQGLRGFEELFGQFFNGMDPFAPRRDNGDMPADDGAISKDDKLLPEERLRLQEEKAKNGGKAKPEKKSAKSKVKTVRI